MKFMPTRGTTKLVETLVIEENLAQAELRLVAGANHPGATPEYCSPPL